MKTARLLLLLIAPFSLAGQSPPCQKFGFVDTGLVIAQLPESKKIEADLQAYRSQLERQLSDKYREYQTKLNAYQTGLKTMIETVRIDMENELAHLQENIQKYQHEATLSLEKKQTELMTPVFEKIGRAIEQVAKDKDVDFVFTPRILATGDDVLLYVDPGADLSGDVLLKLGVKTGPQSK